MRPPKRLEAPAYRTGSSPLNDATPGPLIKRPPKRLEAPAGGQNEDVPPPQLRTPLARAVVPVLGGMGVLTLLGLLTWGVAANIERTESLAPSVYEVGNVEPIADQIAENGPLLLPGLDTSSEKRNVVLNHVGDDPTQGWQVYFAYPEDRNEFCPVRQVRRTATFIDCEDRRVEVTKLAKPPGVFPLVQNAETISIDLTKANTEP